MSLRIFSVMLPVFLACSTLVEPQQKDGKSNKDAKPDFIVTAEDLIKEFNADGEKARNKYKGKTTEVTGRIYMLEPRVFFKDVVIALKGQKLGESMLFAMHPDHTPAATLLSRNQRIKITATFEVNFIGRKLDELEKPTTIQVSAEELVKEFTKSKADAAKKYPGDATVIVFGEVVELTKRDNFRFAKLKGDGKTRVSVTCDTESLKIGDKAHFRSELPYPPMFEEGEIRIDSGVVVTIKAPKTK